MARPNQHSPILLELAKDLLALPMILLLLHCTNLLLLVTIILEKLIGGPQEVYVLDIDTPAGPGQDLTSETTQDHQIPELAATEAAAATTRRRPTERLQRRNCFIGRRSEPTSQQLHQQDPSSPSDLPMESSSSSSDTPGGVTPPPSSPLSGPEEGGQSRAPEQAAAYAPAAALATTNMPGAENRIAPVIEHIGEQTPIRDQDMVSSSSSNLSSKMNDSNANTTTPRPPNTCQQAQQESLTSTPQIEDASLAARNAELIKRRTIKTREEGVRVHVTYQARITAPTAVPKDNNNSVSSSSLLLSSRAEAKAGATPWPRSSSEDSDTRSTGFPASPHTPRFTMPEPMLQQQRRRRVVPPILRPIFLPSTSSSGGDSRSTGPPTDPHPPTTMPAPMQQEQQQHQVVPPILRPAPLPTSPRNTDEALHTLDKRLLAVPADETSRRLLRDGRHLLRQQMASSGRTSRKPRTPRASMSPGSGVAAYDCASHSSSASVASGDGSEGQQRPQGDESEMGYASELLD
jgi:hypothetical protein